MMTNHYFDVWMPKECLGTNKIEGFINADMSDMPMNHFAIPAGKNVIFRCHHREEERMLPSRCGVSATVATRSRPSRCFLSASFVMIGKKRVDGHALDFMLVFRLMGAQERGLAP